MALLDGTASVVWFIVLLRSTYLSAGIRVRDDAMQATRRKLIGTTLRG